MKKLKTISVIIIIFGLLFLSISFFVSNQRNDKKEKKEENTGNKRQLVNKEQANFIELDFYTNDFEYNGEELKTFKKKKVCIFDYDYTKKRKICFDGLDNTIESNFEKFNLNEKDNTLTLTSFNSTYKNNNNLQTMQYIKDDYTSKGYDKNKTKAISFEDKDYNVDVYYVEYYSSKNNKIISELYIFISNDSNYLYISYSVDNLAISDNLINEILYDITVEDNNGSYNKSKVENNSLVYTLKIETYYKTYIENGEKKIKVLGMNDIGNIYQMKYSIPKDNFEEVVDQIDKNNTITFENKNKKYTINVHLGVEGIIDYKDFISKNDPSYENVDADEKYNMKGKNVLKQEYTKEDNKYLEYYYIYDDGVYLKYTFKAKKDYTFKYDELEKLIILDIQKKE